MDKNNLKHGLLRLIARSIAILFITSTIAYGANEAETPNIKELLESEYQVQTNASDDQTPATASPQTTSPEENIGPQDKYNRNTPRGSYQGLNNALKQKDYELAIKFMDMRNLPKAITGENIELAQKLKVIFDRSSWIDVNSLSKASSGHKNDGLPSYRDLLINLELPNGDVAVYMQHVPGENGSLSVWKFSNHSVAKIPLLYKHYGYGELGEKLAKIFPDYSFLSLTLWQWALMACLLLVAFGIAWAITRLIDLILRGRKIAGYEPIQKFLAGPIRFLIFISIFRIVFGNLHLPTMAEILFETKTAPTIAITWLLMGVITLSFARLSEKMKRGGNDQGAMLLRPAATLLKISLIFMALLLWMDNLGFSVTTLIAGLGVGSIAIGLAAQKSIENLIGAITLYVAQPMRLGDFCRLGTVLGVVEEIGLRSTAVRTLDRTLVLIPNGVLANTNVENLTKRDRILYKKTIQLRNDSTPDQVRTILEKVHTMFQEHNDVDPEPGRIKFTEFGEYSLNLEAFAYIRTTDFNRYLGIVEDLNLKILDIISAAGSQLAVPARTIINGQSGAAQ